MPCSEPPQWIDAWYFIQWVFYVVVSVVTVLGGIILGFAALLAAGSVFARVCDRNEKANDVFRLGQGAKEEREATLGGAAETP
jgi:hypothetical protein